MASTYENDLRLEEMATGENSGSWGTKTNTNLELIADAFSYGTETIANADTTITIADGAADAARSLALKINSSEDLTTTRVVTLAPNTTSKVWIIENNTSGGQTLTISAGSGSNVTLPNGVTKIIATDGIGAGSNVTELYTNLHNLTVDDLTVNDDIIMDSDGGILKIGADADLQITHSGTAGTITNSTGDLTVDVAGDIILDAGGGDFDFLVGGTEVGSIIRDGSNLQLKSSISDGDMIFRGNDDGSIISALTLDMSQAGRATFNEGIVLKSSTAGDFGVNINTASGDSMKLQVVDTGSAGAANGLITVSDGNLQLNASGGVVVNESGADADFRVESDSRSNMFFVDGGNNTAHINGTNSSGGDFNIHRDTASTPVMLALHNDDESASSGAGMAFALTRDGGLIFNNLKIEGFKENDWTGTPSTINGTMKFTVPSQESQIDALRLASTAAIFNEGGVDRDFRVESDNETNMLFVDAGNDRIGIATAAPDAEVHISGSHPHIDLGPQGSNRAKLGFRYDNLYLGATAGGGEVILKNNIGSTDAPDASGDEIARFGDSVVINDSGRDQDFRVESNNSEYMLYIDAGQDTVGIKTNATDAALNVNSQSNVIDGIRVVGSGGNNFITGYGNQGNISFSIYENGADDPGNFKLYRNGIQSVFITADENTTTVFNDQGEANDFRVESADHTHMLFVDASQNTVGIGEENSPSAGVRLHVSKTDGSVYTTNGESLQNDVPVKIQNLNTSDNNVMSGIHIRSGTWDGGIVGVPLGNGSNNDGFMALVSEAEEAARFYNNGSQGGTVFNDNSFDRDFRVESATNANAIFLDAGAASGNGVVCIGTNDTSVAGNTGSARGINLNCNGYMELAAYQETVAYFNRMNNDGTIIAFKQDAVTEGTISVSGGTVSYNGFAGRHESSGIPTTTARGTVVSTIDELDEYLSGPKQGQTRADHAKVEVSDSVGDPCVYGVVDDFTDDGSVNVVSVGIAPVRVTGACAKGDLLESNGDGTAKVQSDDIIRSKTIGKVTIGNSDTGVKLVPCVMYCG